MRIGVLGYKAEAFQHIAQVSLVGTELMRAADSQEATQCVIVFTADARMTRKLFQKEHDAKLTLC